MSTEQVVREGNEALAIAMANEAAVASGTRLLLVEEVAARLRLHPKTVIAKTRARVIPGAHVGKEWSYHWPTVVARFFTQPNPGSGRK